MGVKHEATEGGPEVKGQCLIHHAQEDELYVQLLGDFVYGEILSVQTHPGKELELVPESVHRQRQSGSFASFCCHSWVYLSGRLLYVFTGSR